MYYTKIRKNYVEYQELECLDYISKNYCIFDEWIIDCNEVEHLIYMHKKG